MINYVKKKNKDELQKYKLYSEINNKNSYKQRANIMQVIKKNELNSLNFNPMKYKRKLLNIQNPKRELIKNKEIQKTSYTKQDPSKFFGPYNRYIVYGGGFCKRLFNKNYNLNKIYDPFLYKILKFRLRQNTEQINLYSYGNNDNIIHKSEKKRSKEKNILIEEHNIFNTYTNTNNNSNSKIRYNLKSNNRNNSLETRHQKINIHEVNNSIKYLKLGKNLITSSNSSKKSKKEKSRKNKNDKMYQNHLIDISNKKNQTGNNYKKLVFNGINHINNLKKINIKKNPESTHNLEINQVPMLTPRIEEYIRNVKLVKDTIEQFSMENKEIKKFSNLSETDNILLNFSPIKKGNKSFDSKNHSNNYIISSNRIEYSFVKQKPKIEPKTKLIIKTNELEILSNSQSKINLNKDIINTPKEEEKEKEKEIIIINNEEEKKEENTKVEPEKGNEDTNQNKQEEKKEIENINDEIKINIIEDNKEEIIENRRPSKTVVDRLAKYKERLKKRNEANKQKENNKPNKIKNLAFELENKMFKKDVEQEEEKQIKTEVKTEIEKEKEKENYYKPINETNYNIPVINKKKMKKKVFDGL